MPSKRGTGRGGRKRTAEDASGESGGAAARGSAIVAGKETTTIRCHDVLVCDLAHDHPELLLLIGMAAELRDQLSKKNKTRKTLNLIIHVRDADPHKVEQNHFVTSTLATIRAVIVDAQKGCLPTSRIDKEVHLARGKAAVLRGQVPRKVGNLAGNISSDLPADHALARQELHAVVHAEQEGLHSIRASMSTAKKMAPFIAAAGPELSSSPLQPVLLKVFTDKELRAPWGLTQIHVPCRAVLAKNMHTSHVAVLADQSLDSESLVVGPGETAQVGWAKRSDRLIDEGLIDEGLWELFPRSPLSSSSRTRRGHHETEMRLFAISLVNVRREADGLHYCHDPRTVHLEVWQLRLKREPEPPPGSTYPIPRAAKYGGGHYVIPPIFGTPFTSEVVIERVQSAKLCPQEIAVSSRVYVRGLESRPQLNWVKGTVVGEQVERWQVKLDTGEELALRSANLQAGSTDMLGLPLPLPEAPASTPVAPASTSPARAGERGTKRICVVQ